METRKSISIFDYLDYRKFLSDYYQVRKDLNAHFSYRVLAEKAGIASTGYISEILGGKRFLTRKKVPNIAKALALSDKERGYLELMVAFNHAKSEEARHAAYEEMVRALPVPIQRLRSSQQEYFSKWYYVAVREALAIVDIADEYDELAATVRPPISVPQTKAAMRLLESLGLVARDARGLWKATQISLLSQSDPESGVLVRSFQGEMIALAGEALNTIPKEERHITTMTMSVSADGFERIKSILKDSHARILEIVQSDSGEDRVMQMNTQIFPITCVRERKPHAKP